MALAPAARGPTALYAAPALKRVVKERTKTLKAPLRDLWALVVCARILQGGWRFWRPVKLRLGLRAVPVEDFAKELSEALPELGIQKARRVASELVEDAGRPEIGFHRFSCMAWLEICMNLPFWSRILPVFACFCMFYLCFIRFRSCLSEI